MHLSRLRSDGDLKKIKGKNHKPGIISKIAVVTCDFKVLKPTPKY
jgi:hypothetical protein